MRPLHWSQHGERYIHHFFLVALQLRESNLALQQCITGIVILICMLFAVITFKVLLIIVKQDSVAWTFQKQFHCASCLLISLLHFHICVYLYCYVVWLLCFYYVFLEMLPLFYCFNFLVTFLPGMILLCALAAWDSIARPFCMILNCVSFCMKLCCVCFVKWIPLFVSSEEDSIVRPV